ncbi:MAG: DUF4097 family beta strand repeat-containing protein [Candidatus Acidiferrales bacterium]
MKRACLSREHSRLILLTLGVLLCVSPAFAEFDQTFSETYPLAMDGSLTLTNVNGSVSVEGWSRPEVKIEAVKIARGSPSDLYRVKIDVRATRNSVEVATRYPDGEGVQVTVNYRVLVPYRAALPHVTTVNGDVVVRGVESSGELRTVNGGIQLLESAGRFDLRSTNGNVHAELASLRAADGLNVETVNGAVYVALAPGSSAELDISSMNGEFRSELPITTTTSRDFRGRLGQGGCPVRIRTINGGIQLVSSRPTV